MSPFTIIAIAIAIAMAGVAACFSLTATPSAAAKPNQLRHVVILMFKPAATKTQINQIEQDFSGLKAKIPQVADIEWGTNVSPENLAKGYTHCFLVTFKNSTNRDAYLVHPEHKKFVEKLLPLTEQVFVIDFNTNHSS